MIKLAVVDSGVNEIHPRFTQLNLAEQVDVTEGSIQECRGDVLGHGTACTDVIRKTLGSDIKSVEFVIVRVFTDKLAATEEVLIRAIRYAVDVGAHVISVSLGMATCNPSRRLFDVCSEATDAGAIIVAAGHKHSMECYPAHFPQVFGVAAGIVGPGADFGAAPKSVLQFVGRGTKQRLAWCDGGFVIDGGTSYAASHIAGVVAKARIDRPDWGPDEIRSHLLASGRRDVRLLHSRQLGPAWGAIRPDSLTETVTRYFDSERRFRWMDKICLYPLSNKEMHAFLTFPHLCSFTIADVMDFPTAAVSERFVSIDGRRMRKKWEPESVSGDVDTFVIGYPHETPFMTNQHRLTSLLKLVADGGKNVFAFSKELAREALELHQVSSKGGTVYEPKVGRQVATEISSLNLLGPVAKPVFGIVGTGSEQGKFSAQLRIKETLERRGYRVGWLSTEPQGELFGASFSFPYGFQGSVGLELDLWPSTLSGAMKGIEAILEPDILLTGHQAWLIPPTRSALMRERLRALLFLSGVQPDAVGCTVSPEDAIERVVDVVALMKSLYGIPVLFLLLHPVERTPTSTKAGVPYLEKRRLCEAEWGERARLLTERTGLPVFDVMSVQDSKKILECLESYFARNVQ